jgi:hypothetical protein
MTVELSLPGKDYKRDGSLLFKDEPPVGCRLVLVELENGRKEVLCTSLTDSAQVSPRAVKKNQPDVRFSHVLWHRCGNFYQKRLQKCVKIL